jgi:hypothetical protein
MIDEGAILDAVVENVQRKFAGYGPADVRSITYTLYVDSTGDDAVRFRIILADRPDNELHDAMELRKIDDALAEAIRSKGLERIPYADFATETEDSETDDDGEFSASPGPQA